MNSAVPVVPTGWRILVDPISIPETTEGGIHLPAEAIRAREYMRYAGTVIGVGPLAYSGDKFKVDGEAKPWCKVGDTITFGQTAGQRVYVKDPEQKDRHGYPVINQYRLLNDDEVLAVITDPAAVVIEV